MDKYIYYTEENNNYCFKLSDEVKLQSQLLHNMEINIIKLSKINNIQHSDSITQACKISESLYKSFYYKVDTVEVVKAHQKTEIYTEEDVENVIMSKLEKKGFTFTNTKEYGTVIYDNNRKKLGFISYDLDKYYIKTVDFKLNRSNEYICISGNHDIDQVKSILDSTLPKSSCIIS